MATNSSRGNDIATSDGPPKETPLPPLADDVKAHIKAISPTTAPSTAEHIPGQNHAKSTETTKTPTADADADMKREMEGLERSEVAQRGGV